MEEPIVKVAAATAPANVGLIKYWGKKNFQEGANASLSLTLNALQAYAHITQTNSTSSASPALVLEITVNGHKTGPAVERVRSWWERLAQEEQFFAQGTFTINSKLNFPGSAGLGGSGAAFAALAAAAWQLQAPAPGPLIASAADLTSAARHTISRWARWGSGSAARSIQGPAMLWGSWEQAPASNDDYAILAPEAAYLQDWQDGIVLIDPGPKKISSREGHQLMQKHWAAEVRYQKAAQNLAALVDAFKKQQDALAFKIIEQEAWALIALMMTSDPPYTLITPQTLQVINLVKAWQIQEQVAVTFTLDAGPNVHLLWRASAQAQVQALLQRDLLPLKLAVLMDQAGAGIKLAAGPAGVCALASTFAKPQKWPIL